MKDVKAKLSLNVITPKKPFKLIPLQDYVNDSKSVKHIFGMKNNVTFRYFEDNTPLETNTTSNHVHWKRVNSFLKTVFEKKMIS